MHVGLKPPHHLARRPPVPPHSRGRRGGRWLMRAGTRPQHHPAAPPRTPSLCLRGTTTIPPEE
eukprot:scaffold738_cov201-Isochrysis_galbana.AAC.1